MSLPLPRTDWWREFDSAELDRLEQAALANNRELRVAIARIAQANAQVRVAESTLYPSLEIYAKREVEAPAQGIGLAKSREEWSSLNRLQVGVRANYEADLWGKQGYAAESALALALASVHQRDVVALTLTSDVAAAYLDLLSLGSRAAIAERAALSRRKSLAAMQRRMRLGDATTQEVAQFRVAAATAEAAFSLLVQQRERAFNRLAILTGIAPAALRVDGAGLGAVGIPAVAPGLPSDLLCRRPDIRRAEAQLAAAQFDVRAVRAALLPSFSLTADTGFGARHLAALTNPASLFFLAAGTLAQSLFDGGRREAQLELARARHLELLEQYSGTLLTALREIEDSLVAVRATREQHRAHAEASATARANWRMSERAFAAGAADLVALLDAEQRSYASELAEDAARYDRMRAAIDLYKALGGGSRAGEVDPCAQ